MGCNTSQEQKSGQENNGDIAAVEENHNDDSEDGSKLMKSLKLSAHSKSEKNDAGKSYYLFIFLAYVRLYFYIIND